jgi:hypothetical protein
MPDSTFTATPSFGAQSAPSPAKAGPIVEFRPPPTLNLKPPKPAPAPAPPPAAEKTPAPAPKAEEAPPPAQEAKPAEPEPPRKHKLKVHGEELELEEAEVLRRAQKYTAADRRFEDAAKLKREAAQETQRARELFAAAKDPKKLKQVLSDPRVGADVKLIAKEWLAEALREQIAAQEYGPLPPEEEAKLTAEQRELRQMKREAKERERKAQEDAAAAEKAKADEAEKAEQERVAKHRDELGTQILSVMKEAKHLPQDAVTAQRISAELRRNIEEGRPFDVKDVVERLDRAEGKDLARRLKAMGVAKVRAHLPPEFLSGFRDADVAEYKARGGKPPGDEPKAAVATPGQQPEKKGYSEAELRVQLQGKSWRDFAPRAQQLRNSDGTFK